MLATEKTGSSPLVGDMLKPFSLMHDMCHTTVALTNAKIMMLLEELPEFKALKGQSVEGTLGMIKRKLSLFGEAIAAAHHENTAYVGIDRGCKY